MTQSNDQITPFSVSALVRVAIIVSDLESASAFYRDCLNHTDVFWEGTLEGGPLERLLGVPEGTQCRACILAASSEHMGMVGLFELPKQPEVSKTPDTSNRGEAFLVFYVSDLDEVVVRLKARGHTILCHPLPFEDGGRIKQREMSCVDPDGTKINLIEWDPDQTNRPEHDAGQARA